MSWETRAIDFSSIPAVNDNPDFQIRITLDDASSPGTGNNKYDNIKLNGDLIVACPSSDDFSMSTATGTYDSSSFVGVSGVEWIYNDARDEGTYGIDAEGLILRRAGSSSIEAFIPGGMGVFSFEYRKAFTNSNERQLELLVDGQQVAVSPEFGAFSGADATVYTFSHPVNTLEDVNITIKNVGTTATNRHVTIDNISWDCPVVYHWLPTSGTHDYNIASNWDPPRNTPENHDILIFDSGGSSVANNVATDTVGQVIVENTDISFMLVSGFGAQEYTIQGVPGADDFKVDLNSAFTFDSDVDFDLLIAQGATAEIYGDITMTSSGNSANHRFLTEDIGSVVFKNGASFTQGPQSGGNVFGTSGDNNVVVFESGSVYIERSGGNPFGKTQPDSKVEFQTGSTYRHEKGVIPSIAGRAYANMEFNFNGTLGFLSGSVSGVDLTCDDFTILQGDLDFNYSTINAPLNLNINGDLSIAAGSNLYLQPDDVAASSSIRLMGSATQNISGAGNIHIGQYGKLEIGNDINLNSPLNIYGLLELQSAVINTNNNLTIASDSESTGIIDDFSAGYTGTLNGDVTVERYVTNPNNGFHFVGSPVAAANLSDWGGEFSISATNGGSNNAQVIPAADCSDTVIAANSPYGGLFDYREDQVTDCRFSGWHVRTSGTVLNAQGFAGIIPSGTTIDLSGLANTGNITSYDLTRTNTNTSTHQGFNMLANPYPSPVEWTDVATANTGIDGTAYLFETSGAYNGTFQTINDITGGTIGSSQAFQVEVLNIGSTNVDFINNMRRTTGNNDFLRQSQPYDSRLILELQGNGFADRTIVAYADDFTSGYDRSFDAKKLKSNHGQPTIYTFSNPDIEKQSINAIANSDKFQVLPIGFIAGTSGNYTITASDLNTFDPMEMLFMEDLKEGIVHNLREGDYNFNANKNEAHHRFNLHLMPAPEIVGQKVNCDLEPGSIHVDFSGFQINGQNFDWDKLQLKDSLGNPLQEVQNPANLVQFPNLQAGEYELYLEMGNYNANKIIEIEALAFVEADYNMDKTVAEPGETVAFTNLSFGAADYEWDMGDGTVLYNSLNPTHTYLDEGIYTVTLSANSDDCTDQFSSNIEIRSKATFIADLEGNAVHIYSYASTIVVEGENLAEKDIRVFNMLGLEMNIDYNQRTANRAEIQMPMAASGVYFVKVQGNSKVYSSQVFIESN
ncbi:MAG: PKD domain-containing protein [Chitinophagales bacterium]